MRNLEHPVQQIGHLVHVAIAAQDPAPASRAAAELHRFARRQVDRRQRGAAELAGRLHGQAAIARRTGVSDHAAVTDRQFGLHAGGAEERAQANLAVLVRSIRRAPGGRPAHPLVSGA
ncbi:MAG: hypothetical protein MZV64_30730 [Ignavibacteriales bacterium]|nr:hypothetical protein [Ignavibacteriales bacterium]